MGFSKPADYTWYVVLDLGITTTASQLPPKPTKEQSIQAASRQHGGKT
jgi:hypothetical protein